MTIQTWIIDQMRNEVWEEIVYPVPVISDMNIL